jgi:hypothetical protein
MQTQKPPRAVPPYREPARGPEPLASISTGVPLAVKARLMQYAYDHGGISLREAIRRLLDKALRAEGYSVNH